MNKPQFSIVIPNYNYAALLRRAVTSACNQKHNSFEVIVVDDGSTDESSIVLDDLLLVYPGTLKVVYQPNAGAGAARNNGVKHSCGEYLVFLDADDELLDGALELFDSALESTEADVVVATNITRFVDGSEKAGKKSRISSDPDQRFSEFLDKKIRCANGAMALHRKVFQTCQFSENLRQAEDLPLFAHAMALFDCAAIADPTVRVYKHSGSRRHDVSATRAAGLKLVDEVFNPAILPAALMRYRDAYSARRCLSIFRSLQKAGEAAESRSWYLKALKQQPLLTLRSKHTAKFLLSFFR